MSERSQLERLARPIPGKYVSPPAPGKYGDFVSHDIVNQILLGILGPFSFRVEQVVYNPDGLLDGCTASLTAIVDGREVTVTEGGDCEFPENKKTQGDRLKNAASDALKRCAMRLGLGLHLWSKGDYFLYEQLSKRGVESSRSAPPQDDSQAGVAAPSPATGSPSTTAGEPVAQSTKQALATREAKLMGDLGSQRVMAERKKRQLPRVDKATAEQLSSLDEMLGELEREYAEMARPFSEAS